MRVTVEDVVKVVNAPVLGVVAPTVPLMLMLAVPVRFVTVPLDGVPKAGVTSVGLVAKTFEPEPVLVTLTTFLLASKAKAVEAVRPDRVVVPEAARVVKAPVVGAVAPTVPLNGPAKPPAVSVVPLKVRLADAPNTPLLLNCT